MKPSITFNPIVAARFGHGYTLTLDVEPSHFGGICRRVYSTGEQYLIDMDYDEDTLLMLATFAIDTTLTREHINEVLLIADKIARHYATGGDRNPERKLFAQSKIRLIMDLVTDLYAAVDYHHYLHHDSGASRSTS